MEKRRKDRSRGYGRGSPRTRDRGALPGSRRSMHLQMADEVPLDETPTAPIPRVREPGTRTRSWSRLARKSALVLVPILVAAFVAYALSSVQGARGQQGIEESQEEHDSSNSTPVRVVVDPDSERAGGFSRIFDRPVGLAEAQDIESNSSNVQTMKISKPDAGGPYSASRSFAFTLVGQNYAPVLIDDITVQITARRSPISGTVIFVSPQGGGVTVERLGFDLDSHHLSARTIADNGSLAGDYFSRAKIALKKDESVPFVAEVHVSNCDCDFVLLAHYAGGRSQPLDNNGRPWRASAFAPSYHDTYAYDIEGSPPGVVVCRWPTECQRY
jgi:hypothetical protein